MADINVTDRVRIVRAEHPEQRELVNRVGTVVMIVDGTRCVVAFPDGSGATVDIGQLAKAE